MSPVIEENLISEAGGRICVFSEKFDKLIDERFIKLSVRRINSFLTRFTRSSKSVQLLGF